MSSFLLRDHAKEILQSIVKDISEPQSSEDQTEKFKGLLKSCSVRWKPRQELTAFCARPEVLKSGRWSAKAACCAPVFKALAAGLLTPDSNDLMRSNQARPARTGVAV